MRVVTQPIGNAVGEHFCCAGCNGADRRVKPEVDGGGWSVGDSIELFATDQRD